MLTHTVTFQQSQNVSGTRGWMHSPDAFIKTLVEVHNMAGKIMVKTMQVTDCVKHYKQGQTATYSKTQAEFKNQNRNTHKQKYNIHSWLDIQWHPESTIFLSKKILFGGWEYYVAFL